MKTALVCGVSGQDGGYLAKTLLEKGGYHVVGTSRDAPMRRFSNLRTLGIFDRVEVASMSMNDFRSVLQVVQKYRPDEIYNLAGQSSVGLSFEQPVETMESISTGTLNLLEVIRILQHPTRVYNASSGECFGNTGPDGANEDTPFRPRSPYAIAKAAAYYHTVNHRESYDLFACSGILFNHESPLRPERFVTRKIVCGAVRIKRGEQAKLELGRLDVHRDWGWAPDYVEAMWRMLQQDRPEDFVIATGESHSLQDFVEAVFAELDLSVEEHLVSSPGLRRPNDIEYAKGDASRAAAFLDWRPEATFHEVIRRMVASEWDANP